MKKMIKYLIAAVALVAMTGGSASCLRQDLVFYEDGDFDGEDYREGSERMLLLSDLDADDTDRY